MKSTKRRQYTRSSYLPASTLARQGRCETLAWLEMHEGESVTPAGEKARQAGLAEHDRFHLQVVSSHNDGLPARGGRGPSSGRSPCFVASAVYGADDARTDELRAFRDQVLLRSHWTAWTVRFYYACSPPIARWLSTRPGPARFVARMLDMARIWMVRPLMEKGSYAEDDIA